MPESKRIPSRNRSIPDIARIVAEEFLGAQEPQVERYPTGLCHYVFSARSSESDEVVIRISPQEVHTYFQGSMYWYERLKTVGVPLPRVLKAGSIENLSFVVLERVDGKDLGLVYESLSPSERRAIAFDVASIQDSVSRLPAAAGFGHAFSYDDPTLKSSWEGMLRAQLERSRMWMDLVGRASSKHVSSVEDRLSEWSSYFSQVQPQPFLDDLTTKNVLVKNGRVVGIVDCDQVCFGDRLLVLGLTKMALLSMGAATDYIDAWSEAWNLSDSDKKIVSLYTAIFCVGFISEMGMSFNAQGRPFDEQRYRQHAELLDSLLQQAVS